VNDSKSSIHPTTPSGPDEGTRLEVCTSGTQTREYLYPQVFLLADGHPWMFFTHGYFDCGYEYLEMIEKLLLVDDGYGLPADASVAKRGFVSRYPTIIENNLTFGI